MRLNSTLNCLRIIFVFCLSFCFFSCSNLIFSKPSKEPLKETPIENFDYNKKIKMGLYKMKIDHFMIILDSSSSMSETYNGQYKFEIARDIILRLNQIAPDVGVRGGLRLFGDPDCMFCSSTTSVYGIERYFRTKLERAVKKLPPPNGESPMNLAIKNVRNEIVGTGAQNFALIIMSDWKEIHDSFVTELNALIKIFQDKLCVYPVIIGNSVKGKERVYKVEKISKCGLITSGDVLASNHVMADFVKEVFLQKIKCPSYLDAVSNKLEWMGDDDGDGINDCEDRCPNTPTGVKTDDRGCWTIEGLYFDTDKYDIRPQYYHLLDTVVEYIKGHPELCFEIQGHTDHIARPEYNLILSNKRARAVVEYLIEIGGIDPERLTWKGYGMDIPAASNKTAWGRAKNRRTEIHKIPCNGEERKYWE